MKADLTAIDWPPRADDPAYMAHPHPHPRGRRPAREERLPVRRGA